MQVLDFVVNNWYFILVGVLQVIVFIVTLCKKTKVHTNLNDSVKATLAERLPVIISLSEQANVPGADKKALAVSMCLNEVTKLFGVSLSIKDNEYWTTYISEQIEKVLSTPQKKEI